jgi:uncharacterized membrane protein YkoI
MRSAKSCRQLSIEARRAALTRDPAHHIRAIATLAYSALALACGDGEDAALLDARARKCNLEHSANMAELSAELEGSEALDQCVNEHGLCKPDGKCARRVAPDACEARISAEAATCIAQRDGGGEGDETEVKLAYDESEHRIVWNVVIVTKEDNPQDGSSEAMYSVDAATGAVLARSFSEWTP